MSEKSQRVRITLEGEIYINPEQFDGLSLCKKLENVYGGVEVSVEYPEPAYPTGTVVRDANGTHYKRVGSDMWQRFGLSGNFPDSAPKRPLEVLSSGIVEEKTNGTGTKENYL